MPSRVALPMRHLHSAVRCLDENPLIATAVTSTQVLKLLTSTHGKNLLLALIRVADSIRDMLLTLIRVAKAITRSTHEYSQV